MKRGISLISLIITIIAIIILASITIFSSLGTVDQSQLLKRESEFEDVCTFVRAISVRAEAGLIDFNLSNSTVATSAQISSIYTASGELTAEEQNRIVSVNESGKANKYKYHYITGKQLENANIPGLEDVVDKIGVEFPSKVENDYIINFYSGVVVAKVATDKTLVRGNIVGKGNVFARNDVYTVGQEVEYNGESFFVIENSDEKSQIVKLLAKYNLGTEVGSDGKFHQSNVVYGETARAFSSTNYWSANATDGLNLNNYTIPSSENITNNVIKIAQKYGSDMGATKGRLLTVEEVEAFGGSRSSNSTADCPSWINGRGYDAKNGWLLYWLGSAYNNNRVRRVIGNSNNLDTYNYSNASYSGVRPVIEVVKSKLSNFSGGGNTTPSIIFTKVGTVTNGTEITATFNGRTEYYYVAGEPVNGKVLLLTKYNLGTTPDADDGYYYQQNTGTNNIEFCTDPDNTGSGYWGSGVVDDLSIITSETANGRDTLMQIVRRYGSVRGVTAKLLTYSQVQNLGLPDENLTEATGYLRGVDSKLGYLYWWIGSSYSAQNVRYINGKTGAINAMSFGNANMGIRPVLEVPLSDIQL